MLVTYSSSDEEEETQPTKPAKIARRSSPIDQSGRSSNTVQPSIPPHITKSSNEDGLGEVQGPAPGPSIDIAPEPSLYETSPPLSPYSTERQRVRELTLPTYPDFAIPDSPPPPPTDSEAAARLAATTKKFNKFLELKRQGVHFNSKLESSISLRNPNLLPKLMDFAGISREESYASTLPEGLGVPVKWDEECYVEALLKTNESSEKKRLASRDKIEFVPGKT